MDKAKIIQIYVKLTEEEKRDLKAAAAKAGIPAYDWNREALLAKLDEELETRKWVL